MYTLLAEKHNTDYLKVSIVGELEIKIKNPIFLGAVNKRF